MNFNDFTPEELVGKKVLYTNSSSLSTTQGIRTIVRVTKTGFALNGVEGLFNFMGSKKGGDGRTNWGTHVNCKLITEEQANELTAKWAITKRMNAAKEAIQHEIKSGRPTVEQLEAACKALGLTQ